MHISIIGKSAEMIMGGLHQKFRFCIGIFFEENLIPHLKKNQIDKTIVVQAAPTIEETEFILTQSEKSSIIAGVVGWIDVENPAYKKTVSAISEASEIYWNTDNDSRYA